jgi:hypothetical protein
MLRRNPDILAITLVVLVIGAVTLIAEASHVVARKIDFERGQHFARKVQLIGERAEMIGKRIEEKAEMVEQRVTQAAERAERLGKVWE